MEHVNLARELARKVGKLVTALGAVDLGLTLLSIPLGYDYLTPRFIITLIAGYQLRKGEIASMLRWRTVSGIFLGLVGGYYALALLYRPQRILLLQTLHGTEILGVAMELAYLAASAYLFLTFSSPKLGFLVDPTGTPLKKRFLRPKTSLIVGVIIIATCFAFDLYMNTQHHRELAVAASGKTLNPDSIYIDSWKISCASKECTTSAIFFILEKDPPEKVYVTWKE